MSKKEPKRSAKTTKRSADAVDVRSELIPSKCRCGGALRPLSSSSFDYPKRLILRWKCKECGKLSVNVILNPETASHFDEILDETL